MRFLSRRLVLPSDLNYSNSLFGGRVLQWIDVLKGSNKATKKTICLADDIVFVQVDTDTRLPKPHGKTMKMLRKQAEQELKEVGI